MSLLLLLTGQTDTAPADLDLPYKAIRDDIARILRARTAAGGGETGEFNERTNPKASEVDELINDAAALIAPKVGVNLPESTWPMARRVVAIRTAMLIELGSSDFDERRYDRFERDLNSQITTLVDAVQDARDPGNDPGPVDDRVGALGTFPVPTFSWDTEVF